jgi:hypothetical protein
VPRRAGFLCIAWPQVSAVVILILSATDNPPQAEPLVKPRRSRARPKAHRIGAMNFYGLGLLLLAYLGAPHERGPPGTSPLPATALHGASKSNSYRDRRLGDFFRPPVIPFVAVLVVLVAVLTVRRALTRLLAFKATLAALVGALLPGALPFVAAAFFEVTLVLLRADPFAESELLCLARPSARARTASIAFLIGFLPSADDCPTAAPATPPITAPTGPPISPPTTAPVIPPAVCFETGRVSEEFEFIVISALRCKGDRDDTRQSNNTVA